MDSSLEKAISIIIDVASPDKIILFGSRAGENYDENSDYDLLVLKRNVQQARRLAQMIYMSFEDIGAPIDVLVADYDKYEKHKDDPYMIYSEAAKNGKVVYEQ